MLTFLTFFILSFFFTKRTCDERRYQKKEQERIHKEKEEVIQFVEENLYHNELTSIYYGEYYNNQHILQIQYKARFYRVYIEKLIGVNEFTYHIEELQNQQINTQKQVN